MKSHEWRELVAADDFSSFFDAALRHAYRKKGRVNISEFSRRAGFRSRSYVTELIAGKKGLSGIALRRIQSTLKLPRPLSQAFELLAYERFPELRPASIHEARLRPMISAAKTAFLKQCSLAEKPLAQRDVISSPWVYQVFAALGSDGRGASLSEICARTDFSEKTASAHLQTLLSANLVRNENERYFAHSSQMDFLGLSSGDGLSPLIGEVLSEISKAKEKILEDRRNLTLYSAVSINTRDIPLIREKLKEAFFAVLDQYQVDDGDRVKQVFLSFR